MSDKKMTIEEKMKQILGGGSEGAAEGKPSRSKNIPTKLSVKGKLLHIIAERSDISGKRDFHEGHLMITSLLCQDKDFAQALDTVIDKIFFTFHRDDTEGEA